MKKLLAIVGPTGVGKTSLGLQLAKKFNGEIVSADSRQIYIGMDMGTGKGSQSSEFRIQKFKEYWTINDIKIHLYDLITPKETFSVAQFQQEAQKAIQTIQKENKLPILVGGTGLYVRAVVEGLKLPKAAPDQKLRRRLEAQPLTTLITELEEVDPETAKVIDKQNPRRIIRALEIYHQTGEKFSDLKGKFNPQYKKFLIGLSAPRDFLYNKVDRNIEEWFENGFIDEVKMLLAQGYSGNLPAMTSLGYRQVIMYLEGKISLKEAIQRTAWEHHGYIRRQLTWFHKTANVRWFDVTEPDFVRQIEDSVRAWLTTATKD